MTDQILKPTFAEFFGVRLREFRQRLKMTQAEFGKASGMGGQTLITNLEAGSNLRIGLAQLEALASFARKRDISRDGLLFGEDAPAPHRPLSDHSDDELMGELGRRFLKPALELAARNIIVNSQPEEP